MAHGFAATKDCGLDSFARGLAAIGLDVLAFDYRGFGASGGAPRQVISPAAQVEDYRAALRTAATLPGVDPNRLILWGVSLSGGTVLEVAAGRSDIAALISVTPLVSASADRFAGSRGSTEPAVAGGAPALARLLRRALRDKYAALTGGDRHLTPAVGRPGTAGLLTVPGAYEDYVSIAGPTWRNEVNASFALDAVAHRPHRFAPALRCPALFQIADLDRCVPERAATRTATRARAQVRHYPCDHFDIYPGKPWHETVRAHQTHFLTNVLTIAAAPDVDTAR
ncbi:alpha/beta hydrolase [Nocardia sp. NPDC055321]